ncbi:hypothetical protein KIN20_011549 [Parelaphostrongylus tenuis]|uniref:Uncharacterized protein n=1 Tax=Parelaphostrongylus tenuis TaxID=148309 RepID=A0AAD5QL31_PARTN|nr:hypothetical protein KIN20_011549 [Parelaphostrongylus tenuis]
MVEVPVTVNHENTHLVHPAASYEYPLPVSPLGFKYFYITGKNIYEKSQSLLKKLLSVHNSRLFNIVYRHPLYSEICLRKWSISL